MGKGDREELETNKGCNCQANLHVSNWNLILLGNLRNNVEDITQVCPIRR